MPESLALQWLGLCSLTAKGPSSIPGQGTKIPQAAGTAEKNNNNKEKEKEIKRNAICLPRGICELLAATVGLLVMLP